MIEEDYWTKNGIKKPKVRIVCAAIRFGDTILAGARHWDSVMHTQCKMIGKDNLKALGKEEQGFIDQFGEFYDRKTAMKLVLEGFQSFDKERNGGHMNRLISEGLY